MFDKVETGREGLCKGVNGFADGTAVRTKLRISAILTLIGKRTILPLVRLSGSNLEMIRN